MAEKLSDKNELRTSKEWYEHLYPKKEVEITDPLGWDKQNWQYSWEEELITHLEFNTRLVLKSICSIKFK